MCSIHTYTDIKIILNGCSACMFSHFQLQFHTEIWHICLTLATQRETVDGRLLVWGAVGVKLQIPRTIYKCSALYMECSTLYMECYVYILECSTYTECSVYIYIPILYIDPDTNLELCVYIECSIHIQSTTFVNGSTYGGGILLSQMIYIHISVQLRM